MTQPPLRAHQSDPSKLGRPSSVTILAILGIVLGAYGFLCTPFGMARYFTDVGQMQPLMDSIRADHVLFLWIIGITATTWLLLTVVLVCSIGALGLRKWARQGLIGWAVMMMAFTCIEIAVRHLFIVPRTTAIMRKLPAIPGVQASPIAAYVPLLVFGIVWPATLLGVMARTNVKAAFAYGGGRRAV